MNPKPYRHGGMAEIPLPIESTFVPATRAQEDLIFDLAKQLGYLNKLDTHISIAIGRKFVFIEDKMSRREASAVIGEFIGVRKGRLGS